MQLEILVAISPDGSLQLKAGGPLANQPLLVVGVLEKAKDMILHPPEPQSPIAIARAVPQLNGV